MTHETKRTTRAKILRIVLILYAVGSVAIAIPLLFDLTGAGELSGTTSGKILAAAILALAFGAAMASRDPWQDRRVIQVLIGFTVLAALAILSRLFFHHEPYTVDPAWMVLPFAVAAPVLLAVFYPRPPAS